MAKVYPERLPESILQDPRRGGERYVYEKLSALPNDYTIFYSVNWTTFDPLHPFSEGEADFMIVHPDLGVMVLEVKGGAISYDSNSDKWTTTNRLGETFNIKDPVGQGARSRRDLASRLTQFSQWSRPNSLNLCNAVCFPDTYVGGVSLKPDLNRVIIIDRDDIDNHLEEVVRKIFSTYFGEKIMYGKPTPRGVMDLTFLLARSFELRTPLGVELEYEERKLVELTEAQMNTLSFLGSRKRVAISGCAGSGKTMLAVEKAIRLKQEGLNVLLTCFNATLAEDLCHRLENEEIDVFHFHGLARHIADHFDIRIKPVKDEQTLYEEALPDAMVEALESNGPIFDAIIVDEGQDFNQNYWIALSTALKPDGYLYIFFDNNQNIYSNGGQFMGLIEEAPFVLTENCRNTQGIHKLVKDFHNAPQSLVSRGPTGRSPEVITYSSEDDQLKKMQTILNRLVNVEHISPKDIVILTPRSQTNTSLKEGKRVGNFILNAKEGFPPVNIQVSSIHRFKGLERQVVILAEIDNRYTYNPEMVIYVGASRARTHLVIMADEKAPESILSKLIQ